MATQTGSIDLTATRAVHFAAEAGFESINGKLADNYYTKSEFTVEPGQIASYVKEKTEQSVMPNLSPYFSHPFDDVYDATSNPNGYWHPQATLLHKGFTQLEDGWAHFSYTNSGSSTFYPKFWVTSGAAPSTLKPSTRYTFLLELRNWSAGNSSTWIGVATNNAYNTDMFAGSVYKTIGMTAEPAYYIAATTEADITGKVLFNYAEIAVYAGDTVSCDMRLSLYEGEYDGPYKPYVDQSLTTRMSSAETSISQNATDITLRATKEESYQMGQPNLVPWFSAGVPQLPSTYWKYATGSAASMIQMTDMGDGWCRMVIDNTSGTGTVRYDYDPVMAEGIKLGKDYTFLFEFRNIGQATSNSTQVYVVQAGTYGMQFWGNYAQKVLQGTSTDCTIVLKTTVEQAGNYAAELCDDGIYRKRIVRKSEASDSQYWTRSSDKRCVRLVAYCAAGDTFDAEFRFSIYEGEYTGPYKPYSGTKLYASQAELKVANDRITSEVSARETLGQTVASHSTAIEQNASNITMSSKRMETIDGNMLYDVDAPSLAIVNGPSVRYFSDAGNSSFMVCDIREITDPPTAGINYMAHWSVSGSSEGKARGLCFYGQSHVQFISGQKYTFSCWVRCTSGKFTYYNTSYSGSFPSNSGARTIDSSLDSSWQFVTTTVTATKTTLDRVYFSAKTLSDSLSFECDMCGFKLTAAAYATQAELKVANDNINLRVEKNDVINQINLSTEGATISASKVNIEGAAIFTSGRLSDSALASIRLTLTRDNFSDSYWSGYETIGHTDNWKNYHVAKGGTTSATGFASNTLRVGDLVVIEGVSIDTGNTHRVTVKVTQVPSGAGSDIPATTVNAVNSNGIADNIHIGVTNLLPGTQDWSGANKRTNGTYTVTSDTYGGCFVMTQVWGSGNCDLGYQSNVWTQPLEADTWYTLSFWAKASSNIDSYSYLFSSNVIDKSVNSSGRTATGTDGAILNSITTSWQRIWVSWHIKADATAFPQQLIITRLQSTHSGVTAYIAGAKLEKGNKATDWTLASGETVKRTQRIYYRTTANASKPSAPTSAWVEQSGDVRDSWTAKVPRLTENADGSGTKYPALYTCEQYQMGDGTIGCTTVLLDDSATVIDGGNIITGSVATNTLTAYDATIGKISAEAIDLRGVQPAGEYATSSALTTEINQRKAQYGTCSTAVGTTPKVVTCSNFELVAGNELTVKFSNANTSAAKIQLNVNSKGAKDVWVANAVTSATNQLLWGAGAYITFRYDGTQFQVIGEPRTWYGASTTAEGTAAKTDTTAVTGCVICKGAKVELAMSNANTASAPTLNVQSTGAKAVYFGNGTTRPTKAGGTSWLAANTCTFTFDGAAWRTQGKTYIDANSIVTGYLSADRIEAGSLGAEKINVSSISIGDLSGSVGGRNLLRWTDKKYYAGQWNKGTAPVDTYGWYRYSTAMPGEVTDEGIKFTHSSSSTRDGIVMYLAEDNVVVGGEDLVLSFDYRTNVTTFFTPYLLVAETGNIQHDTEMACTESATNWVHGSWKLKFPSTASKTVRALLFGYINNNGGWIEIKSGTLKLERGSRETDWTPAPEDFTAYVDAVQLGVTNLLLETATWGDKLWYDKSGAAIDGDTVTYASNNTSNRMALIPCSSGDVFTVSYDVKASVAITYGASGGSILVDYSNSATSYNRVVYDMVAANSSVGTEWQRVSYTFTVPTNSSIKALTIGLRNMSPSTSCTLYFRYFKLERGSRATDWTPAPEDVVSDINAVQSNLDNFQVGGRNLIKKSADLNECFNATAGVSSIVSGKADPDGGTGAYLLTPNNTTTWYSGPNSSNCLLKNTSVPYTFSIWLRADTATQCKLCCRYMDSTPYSSNATRAVFDVTTEWQRFYISGPLKQVQTSDSVWIGQVTDVPIYAYHPKVEIGTRPTDWTPAKEDVDANIDAVQSDLDMSRSWYAECPTAAGTTAKVATITPTTTSFTTETLTPGTIVHVKFAATNSGAAGSLTLNVNGTGAKPIKYIASGGNVANIPGNGYLIVNRTYEFYYDGTNWVVQMPYNTNNYDRENYKAAVVASAAISAGKIAVFGTDHKLKTLAASAFDVSCPILYVATAYSADDVTKGTARSTNYTFWGSTFTLTNTHSIQGAAAGKPVFIVGTLSGTTFTPNSTVLTCTVPTSVNNLVYLRLGLMSTATAAVLESDHPMYMFFDGKFQQCDPATASAACTATDHIYSDGTSIKIAHTNPSGAMTYQLQTASATEYYVDGKLRTRVNADGMEVFSTVQENPSLGPSSPEYEASVASFGAYTRVGESNKGYVGIGGGIILHVDVTQADVLGSLDGVYEDIYIGAFDVDSTYLHNMEGATHAGIEMPSGYMLALSSDSGVGVFGDLEARGDLTVDGVTTLTPTVLFEGTAKGNFTLSEAPTNFTRLRVYFRSGNGGDGSVDLFTPVNTMKFTCETTCFANSTTMQHEFAQWAIGSSTSVTWQNAGYLNLATGNNVSGSVTKLTATTNQIAIIRVEGWTW